MNTGNEVERRRSPWSDAISSAPPAVITDPRRWRFQGFAISLSDYGEEESTDASIVYPDGLGRECWQSPVKIAFSISAYRASLESHSPPAGRPRCRRLAVPRDILIEWNVDHDPDRFPGYYGDPVGHWEGDTLVVETVGFNDIGWLTARGVGLLS